METGMIAALKKWVSEGRRSVDITLDTVDSNPMKIKIWCYDYNLTEGKGVTLIADIPTTEELKDIKRKSAQAILDNM